ETLPGLRPPPILLRAFAVPPRGFGRLEPRQADPDVVVGHAARMAEITRCTGLELLRPAIHASAQPGLVAHLCLDELNEHRLPPCAGRSPSVERISVADPSRSPSGLHVIAKAGGPWPQPLHFQSCAGAHRSARSLCALTGK